MDLLSKHTEASTTSSSTTNQTNQCPCQFGGSEEMEKSGSAGSGDHHPTATTAGECGSVVGMSRPSLISSLWSIQVQNEGSSSDFPMAGCGSQQSLPEMLTQVGSTATTLPFCSYHHYQQCNGFGGGHSAGAGSQSTAVVTANVDDQMQASPEMISGDGGGLHQMDLQTGTAIIGGGQMQSGQQLSLRPVKSLSDLHTLTAAQIAQTAAAMMPCPHHFHQQQQSFTIQPNNQSYLGFRRQTDTGPYYTTMLSRQQRDSQICEWLQKLSMNGGGSTDVSSESPSQEFYQQQQQRRSFLRADTIEQ